MSLREHVLHHYARSLGDSHQAFEVEAPEVGKILILEFRNSPIAGATTVATAGLSETLAPPLGNELLFTCYDRYYTESVQQLVVSIADLLAAEARQTGARLRPGAVLGPRGPLLGSTEMTVLGVFPPAIYDPGLARITIPEGEVTVCWLLPLYESESDWLTRHGFSEFVKRLHILDPDFLDLRRRPIDPESVTLSLWDKFRLKFL